MGGFACGTNHSGRLSESQGFPGTGSDRLRSGVAFARRLVGECADCQLDASGHTIATRDAPETRTGKQKPCGCFFCRLDLEHIMRARIVPQVRGASRKALPGLARLALGESGRLHLGLHHVHVRGLSARPGSLAPKAARIIRFTVGERLGQASISRAKSGSICVSRAKE